MTLDELIEQLIEIRDKRVDLPEGTIIADEVGLVTCCDSLDLRYIRAQVWESSLGPMFSVDLMSDKDAAGM